MPALASYTGAPQRDTMIGVIVSIDEILVRPDDVARFAARCHAALSHLSGTPGCRSAKLTRSLADPARFLVITGTRLCDGLRAARLAAVRDQGHHELDCAV